jgi:putative FmdB family regulatory protein
MPTYEYVCDKCGHQFEISQSISAPPLKVCPADHCGRQKWGRGKVKRCISAGAGLLFKGSGFYITDYRSEGYKQAAKTASSETKAASSESKVASSESKAASSGPKATAKAAAKTDKK